MLVYARAAVLKRSKNFWPSAVRQCPSPSNSIPTDGPSEHKKLLLTLPLSDVRPGANTQLIILGHACACKFALKCFALKRFALKCKHRIGLTPLYCRRTSQCQEKFFMVGRMGGQRTKRDVKTLF